MGAYLDKPIEDKNPEPGKNDMCAWGACAMQGWRCGMEDAHISQEINLPHEKKMGMLFGVFDGHGGKEVAEYAKWNFKKVLEAEPSFKKGEYDSAFKNAFLKLDANVSSEEYAADTGTTACVVLVTPTQIICSNAGDSRAVLCRDKRAIELSEDHKPDNKLERQRIESTGHHVEDSRVDGNLALSRAFGDFQYKDKRNLSQEEQAVTANPDISTHNRTPDDKFLIVACDGIWDCMTSQKCVDTLIENQKQHSGGDSNLCPPVEKLLDECLADNTEDGIGTDNMTAILVKLYNK